MVHQTTVQNSAHIRFGSAKVLIGAVGATPATNLGAMNGVEVRETWTPVEVKSDNAGILTERIKDHKVTVTGTMLEMDLSKLYTLRGGASGTDGYSAATASKETGHEEQITFAADALAQRIPHPNFPLGTKTILTITSVTSATGGAGTAYLVEDDWSIFMDPEGYTWLVRAPAGDITATQTVYVIFDYTSHTSKTLTSGGKNTVSPVSMKLVSTDENTKDLTVDVYKAYYREGIDIPFQSDDADNPNGVRISMEGVEITDGSRTTGDTLFAITLAE
jgi:hypothetical protein